MHVECRVFLACQSISRYTPSRIFHLARVKIRIFALEGVIRGGGGAGAGAGLQNRPRTKHESDRGGGVYGSSLSRISNARGDSQQEVLNGSVY